MRALQAGTCECMHMSAEEKSLFFLFPFLIRPPGNNLGWLELFHRWAHFNKSAAVHRSQLSQSCKTGDKSKTLLTVPTCFFRDITCGQLAEVKDKETISMDRNTEWQNITISNFASMLTQKAISMKHVLEDCFSCAFEHKSK